MRKYTLAAAIAFAALVLSYAQTPDPITLKERASVSPSGRYITSAPTSIAPSYPDIDTVTRLSTLVINGTALSNQTQLSADGNFISTVYDVRVDSVIKAESTNLLGQTIRVSLPGGVYAFSSPDGKTVYAEVRTPWFKKMEDGKQYYLFLNPDMSRTELKATDLLPQDAKPFYVTTGGPQGVFEIIAGVVKSNSGRLRDPMWQYHNMTFSQFDSTVQLSLSSGPLH